MVSGVTSHSCKWNKPSCGGSLSWLILQVAPLAFKKGEFPALDPVRRVVQLCPGVTQIIFAHHKLICHCDYAEPHPVYGLCRLSHPDVRCPVDLSGFSQEPLVEACHCEVSGCTADVFFGVSGHFPADWIGDGHQCNTSPFRIRIHRNLGIISHRIHVWYIY
jgi:hypothetical protein